VDTNGRDPPPALWAYAYEIVPPRASDHMKVIQGFLEEERERAQKTAQTWSGRLVSEQQVTHILVVSDSPDLGGDANRRLEQRLKRLKATFSRTVPMRLAADGDPTPEAPGSVA